LGKGAVALGTGLGAVAGLIIAPLVKDALEQQIPPHVRQAIEQFSFLNVTTGQWVTVGKVLAKVQVVKPDGQVLDRVSFAFESRYNFKFGTDEPDNDFIDIVIKIDVNPVTKEFWGIMIELGSDFIEVYQNDVAVGVLVNTQAPIFVGGHIQ